MNSSLLSIVSATHHRATGCPDEKPRKLVRTTVNNDEEPSSSTDAFPDGPIRDPALWNLNLDRVNAVINTEHSSEEL